MLCTSTIRLPFFFFFRERQPTVRDEPGQQYLHAIPSLPIYCSHSSKFVTTAQCMDILMDPELSPKLVCTRMPFDVDCNSLFVVDMSKLSNPKDISCDDMGVWKWNGSYRRWLAVDKESLLYWAKQLQKPLVPLTTTYGTGTTKTSPARI